MKRKLFGLVQEVGAKAEDSDRAVAGIDSATPLNQRQDHHPATGLEHGGIGGGEMQEHVGGTRKKPALQEEDKAIAAKAAEHECRSAAARRAWITIRSRKAAAEVAAQATALVTPTGSPLGACVATDPMPLREQTSSEFSAQASDNVGKLFHERGEKAETTTAESERIPDPAAIGESEAKPKRRPPGVKAKEGGTPLKRGAALQVVTYPRPATKAILVRAAREHDQSLSSFLICAGLGKAAFRKKCKVKDLVPRDELQQYA